MTTIVTRTGKGSPLTHVEVDTNFTNLNTAKLEAGAIALGSAATPSISFTGDLDTGVFSPGANQVAVATNGTQRLTVDTAATTSTLPVVHPLGAVGTPSITFTGDLNTGIYSPAADTLALVTAGNNTLHITSGGLVGIGTSSWSLNSVSTKLGVNLSGTTGDGIALFSAQSSANAYVAVGSQYGTGNSNNGSQIRFGIDSTGDTYSMIALATANGSTPVERVRIDRLGNVGIGTTSPGSPLTIESSAGNQVKITYPSVASYFLNATSGGDLAINKDGSEKARIDSSGRLLVGTSSSSRNPLLQVAGALGLANAAMRTYSGTGDLTINLSSLEGLTGSAWKQCGGVIIYSGVEGTLSNSTSLVCYFMIQGLSTYASVTVTNIVGTTTLTLSSAAASSCTLTLDVGNSVFGSALVFLTSTGGGGLS